MFLFYFFLSMHDVVADVKIMSFLLAVVIGNLHIMFEREGDERSVLEK
jgi:hypothetical protein